MAAMTKRAEQPAVHVVNRAHTARATPADHSIGDSTLATHAALLITGMLVGAIGILFVHKVFTGVLVGAIGVLFINKLFAGF
jgi:hypothetical protein